MFQDFVTSLEREGLSSIDIVLDHLNAGTRKIFSRTLMTSLTGVAAAGDHERVLDIVNTADQSLILSETGTQSYILLSHYADQADAENLEKMFQCLQTNNLASTEHVSNLNPLVNVHLNRDDSEVCDN